MRAIAAKCERRSPHKPAFRDEFCNYANATINLQSRVATRQYLGAKSPFNLHRPGFVLAALKRPHDVGWHRARDQAGVPR